MLPIGLRIVDSMTRPRTITMSSTCGTTVETAARQI